MAYFSETKNKSEVEISYFHIVLSIMPPPSCCPTRLLCVLPPIAPLALPIAARAVLRVVYHPPPPPPTATGIGGAVAVMVARSVAAVVVVVVAVRTVAVASGSSSGS